MTQGWRGLKRCAPVMTSGREMGNGGEVWIHGRCGPREGPVCQLRTS